MSRLCVLAAGLWIGISATMMGAEAVNAPISPFAAQDYRGKDVRLEDFSDKKFVIVAFLGTECPLAKLYAGRLQALANEYADRGVVVIGVDSNRHDAPTEIASFVMRHEIQYPLLVDVSCKLADEFGATRTPEVFVLDEQRVVRYRGRVDDQHQPGVSRDKVENTDLKNALEELLAGKAVTVASTQPAGCLIGRPRKADETSSVTWSNQISRVFQKRCQECHRSGDIAPFALMDYEEAAGWGEMIAEVVNAGRMPPWDANPDVGHFSNARTLSDEEKDLILTWVRNGCPEGDKSQLPEPRVFTEGWQLAHEPDAVFNMAEKPFEVPADGGPKGVKYQHFVVDPKFTEDKWLVGAEVQPGAREVVHHIIVYIVPPGGQSRGQDIFLAAYVPGLRNRKLPEGAAKRIPAGAQLKFQIHYTPNGTPHEDMSRIGFIYTEPEAVTQELITTEVANVRFELKPNERNQEVNARSSKSSQDMILLSMSPHMHLRGQAFKFELEKPDGTRETLLDVPHYDFNWQTSYQLTEPLAVPAGSRMYCTALFDNTSRNLANPDPNKTVHWGEQSWQEMMIGYFDVMVPKSASGAALAPISPSLRAEAFVSRLDKDDSGKLSKEELKDRVQILLFFDRIDQNKDGEIDVEEFAEALGFLDRGGK